MADNSKILVECGGPAGVRSYRLRPWSSVNAVKSRLAEDLGYLATRLRLHLHGVGELSDDARLADLVDAALSPRLRPSAAPGVGSVGSVGTAAPAPAPAVLRPLGSPTVRLVLTVTSGRNVRNTSDNGSIQAYSSFAVPSRLEPVFEQVRRAFEGGAIPKLAMEGSGGTYFLRGVRRRHYGADESGSGSEDELDNGDAWSGRRARASSVAAAAAAAATFPPPLRRHWSISATPQNQGRWPIVACFKPSDEEPGCENNPRGLVGRRGQSWGLRRGVRAGEACEREVAAYLLDHGGFSHVPPAVMAVVSHKSLNYEMRPRKAAAYDSSEDDEWKESSSEEEIDVSFGDGDFASWADVSPCDSDDGGVAVAGSADAGGARDSERRRLGVGGGGDGDGGAGGGEDDRLHPGDDDSCSSASSVLTINTLPALLPRLGSHSSLGSIESGGSAHAPRAREWGRPPFAPLVVGRAPPPEAMIPAAAGALATLLPMAAMSNPFACASPSSESASDYREQVRDTIFSLFFLSTNSCVTLFFLFLFFLFFLSFSSSPKPSLSASPRALFGAGAGSGSESPAAASCGASAAAWKSERMRERSAKGWRQRDRRQRLRTSSLWVDGKIGSLQSFVEHNDVAGNVAPHLFPVSEVHRLAILDIRLMNTDRNDANILVQYQRALDEDDELSGHHGSGTSGGRPRGASRGGSFSGSAVSERAAPTPVSTTAAAASAAAARTAGLRPADVARSELAHIHSIVWQGGSQSGSDDDEMDDAAVVDDAGGCDEQSGR
jgi:hypothetical protein